MRSLSTALTKLCLPHCMIGWRNSTNHYKQVKKLVDIKLERHFEFILMSLKNIIIGRQSTRADQRSSAPVSRCKAPGTSDSPSTLRGHCAVAKLPVFPLDSSSPPTSPTKVKGDREGRADEKRRPNHSCHPSHQPPGSRLVAPFGGGRGQKAQLRGLCGGKGLLSESQVRLLVGLYYLPHEHGPSAQKLLQDLTWLTTNCHLVCASNKKEPPQKVCVCPSLW